MEQSFHFSSVQVMHLQLIFKFTECLILTLLLATSTGCYTTNLYPQITKVRQCWNGLTGMKYFVSYYIF